MKTARVPHVLIPAVHQLMHNFLLCAEVTMKAIHTMDSLAGPPLCNEEGSGVILLHELCSTHWRVRANQIAIHLIVT